MSKIALLFGSFSPVHHGHLALARYAVDASFADEVWCVISPRNPLKEQHVLLPVEIRLELLEIAVASLKDPRIRVEKIELDMPSPHYTISTLKALQKKCPEHEFRPLVGSDILYELDQWKSVDTITRDFGWWVFPRPDFPLPSHHLAQSNIEYWEKAPVCPYSSTELRALWTSGHSLIDYMPAEAYEVWKSKVSTILRPLVSDEDWYEEGVRQRRWNHFGEAANCFDRALRLNSECHKARVALEMLQSIQAFYHSDIYNP